MKIKVGDYVTIKSNLEVTDASFGVIHDMLKHRGERMKINHVMPGYGGKSSDGYLYEIEGSSYSWDVDWFESLPINKGR